MSNQVEHPEIAEVDWIDDTFYVEQSRWKTWRSFTKDGKSMITSLSREQCVTSTRWYLKCLQEGFPDVKTHDGTVGGKL